MQHEPRVALITGGLNGLGWASAVELARRGWSLFLQHRSMEALGDAIDRLQAVAEEAADGAGEIAAGQAELTLSDDRETLVEQTLEVFGRIDLLVHPITGGGTSDDLLEIDEEDYLEIMDHGATATLFLMQVVANEMVRLVEAGEIEGPRIVTINSISAYASSVDHAPQCVSRSAASMITRLFADRLGRHGINVYEVRAGIISSGAGDSAHAHYAGAVEEGLTPIRRWGRPADVARAVAAVAEGLLDFSTGEVINVDGGFHLPRL
jgi:3-oxoacyl-[acyl-carrier protein] reductase